MQTLIVIPARFNSTRFPGKPLELIAGRSMIERTAKNAELACASIGDCDYLVATDDERIVTHCQQRSIPVAITTSNLATGSDRALHAALAYSELHNKTPDFILNLQGDAPFTPQEHLLAVRKGLESGCDVATPVVRLDWAALDQLRAHKQVTPFSGTTVISDKNNRALWFSKAIIPAIRQEAELRTRDTLSPIRRHIGLYGYTLSALRRFTECEASYYEKLEGLEQLRLLENGFYIQTVNVDPARVSIPGIDTIEDLKLAERLILEYGDPHA